MRVLLITDNPYLPTGLARMGRHIASFLCEKFEFSYLGLHGNRVSMPNVPYPIFHCEGYGETFLNGFQTDIVITIGDPFCYNYIPLLPNRKSFAWINYVTIDSVNAVGNLPFAWQLPLSNPDLLATPSRFGQEAIMNFLELEAAYWPLGVSDEFFCIQGDKKRKAREGLGLDDCFVIVVVNRNCVRKQMPIVLKVAQRLISQKLENYPGGIKFLIHTQMIDEYGYDLKQLCQDYVLKNVFFCNGNPQGAYNASDIFLTTSGGEGFGLTILEAMKCGLPIVGTNYSSIPELVNTPKSCGILINPSAYLTTEERTELAILNPDDVAKAILEMATNPKKCTQYSVQAQENAKNYSWDIMKNGTVEAIQSIEKRVEKAHIGKNEILKVDLICLEGTQWKEFTYAKVNHVWELSRWNSTAIQEIILESWADWIALIGDVHIQRGWLCELLKSATDETAVVVSTCIDKNGKMIEGEVRCGTNLLFFPEEGLPPGKIDKELSATVFSAALINKAIFQKMGGFKTNLSSSYFDIEYCLRCQSQGYKIIKSAKSIVLKTQTPFFNEKDGHEFKLETETILNTPVWVQYKGRRAKIKTIYGDLEKEPMKFPYRMALDLVCNYKHIDFVDVHHDINILDVLIEKGGRALIVRNMGLGDVFSALYFGARPLKLANPNIHLAVCVNKPYAGVVKWLPFVDEVFIHPDGLAMAKDFDYFKDLSYLPESKDPKSQSPRPEIFAKAVLQEGLFNYDYDALLIPEPFKEKAQATFEKLGIGEDGRKVVGIQATCESPIRVYAPEYLAEVIKLLTKGKYFFDVVLFGQDKHWRWGLEKWNGAHLFSFINQTDDIETMAALMDRCDYCIAPDSGLMHLWAVMKKPTLALFGNIKPENRTKYYPSVTTLYPEGEIDCIPCGDVFNPCPECSDLGAKGIFSGRCMRRLYPERVYLKFLEMIGQEPKTIFESDLQICPLCGGIDFEVENEVDFWDNNPIPKTTFVRCKKDGLVFVKGKANSVTYCEGYFQSRQQKYYEDILRQDEINRQMSNARRVLDAYYK